jgi:hypothetical protein
MAKSQLRPSSDSLQPVVQRAHGDRRVSTDMQRDSGKSLDEDAKANLRCAGKYQGGTCPFGWRFGQRRARPLILDPGEQQAIADTVEMR